MIKKKQKYLGEILVHKGLISDQQLQKVIEEQMRNKKFLGSMLVEQGLISEDDLLAALAEQFNIEPVFLKDEKIDWEVAASFSTSLITDHKCLPVRADADTVTLAITNPLDVWVLNTAEKEAAPRKVKVVLAKSSDMDDAIKEYRRYSIRKMMNKWSRD